MYNLYTQHIFHLGRLHLRNAPPPSVLLGMASYSAPLSVLHYVVELNHKDVCLCACATGSGFFGAISNVWRSAGGGAASSPHDTVKALQAELSTWETLAQVCGTLESAEGSV